MGQGRRFYPRVRVDGQGKGVVSQAGGVLVGCGLRDPPERFVYASDLGDGWEHDVEVLGAGDDRVWLVSGEVDCPSEDCGGPPGYEELLAAAAGQLRNDDGA